MKILYIVDFDLNFPSGILNKVSQQVRIWVEKGNNVQIISTKPSRDKNKIKIKDVIKKYYYSTKKNSSLNNYFFKIKHSSRIQRDINTFNPDIIYYRQGIWFPGLPKVLGAYTTVMEVNTNDLIEIKNESYIRRLIYQFGRNKILDKIDGIVSVTNELNTLYDFIEVPKITIGNGYVFDKNHIEKKKISDRPQLVFVGSPNCQWHGVDKIYKLAKKLPEFDFHIIGMNGDSLDNLKFYGYLSLEKIKKIYQFCDVAIGSLSLYKAGVQESSTLKVREYLSNGLPVILGGFDVDMKGCEYILELPNKRDNIHTNIPIIKEFVYNWKERNIEVEKVAKKLGYETKEEQRLSFLEKVLKEAS
ncbi:hypothetical protein [Aquimarina sp. 2201CG14-23]|uniref:hypothetical protein n=1 Tax=Aquimarina mycalae TaxID=3040073 RepID=UPI0024782362|nr:hypothetical protein [Aquimarina sp. 2201CG14-23]MDH7446375.1 hypothetical protein [Aquimarina sp. 2201CG14-23]